MDDLKHIKQILGKDLFNKVFYKRRVTVAELLLVQFLFIKCNIDYDFAFNGETQRDFPAVLLTVYLGPEVQISVTITFCK